MTEIILFPNVTEEPSPESMNLALSPQIVLNELLCNKVLDLISRVILLEDIVSRHNSNLLEDHIRIANLEASCE